MVYISDPALEVDSAIGTANAVVSVHLTAGDALAASRC